MGRHQKRNASKGGGTGTLAAAGAAPAASSVDMTKAAAVLPSSAAAPYGQDKEKESMYGCHDTIDVRIIDHHFVPEYVQLQRGQAIRWINEEADG